MASIPWMPIFLPETIFGKDLPFIGKKATFITAILPSAIGQLIWTGGVGGRMWFC